MTKVKLPPRPQKSARVELNERIVGINSSEGVKYEVAQG